MGVELTPRQGAFVDAYLVSMNATKAAKKAGYSPQTAGSQGHDLLKKPEVIRAIAERIADRRERVELRQDAVVLELARLATSNMADYMRITPQGDPMIDLTACTREQLGCIQEFTVEDFTEGRGEDKRDVRRVKVKLYNKAQALEGLGKHLGMFLVRLADPDGSPLGSALADRMDLARRAAYLLQHGKPPLEHEAA